MKLISLFDGSGGFPLAGAMCGITPIVASEIEPYPIAVTKSRFPNMIHLGDVSKVNGADLEPADIITFGSPCQDLSVAGKRAGLKHEDNGDEETTRSGLFMEAIRIIKEMREATNGKHPRYAVWENVPGAFSSNKGEDFRVVLEEFVKVVEPSAEMPPMEDRKWPYADVIVGDGWSIAYRTLDAQYWGVPQRRRRIYLVADFSGERAKEILFERDGLRGYPSESGKTREDAAGTSEDRPGTADCEGTSYTLKIRSGVERDCYGKKAGKGPLIQTEKSATLGVSQDQYLFTPEVIGIENHPNDSRVNFDESGTVQTLTGRMGTGGGNVPMVMEQKTFSKERRAQSKDDFETWRKGGVANTLNTFDCGDVRATDLVVEQKDPVYGIEERAKPSAQYWNGDTVAGTLTANNAGGSQRMPDKENFNCVIQEEVIGVMATGQANAEVTDGEISPCITSLAGTGGNNTPLVGCKETDKTYIVRRLTPTECARLQGFPDWWGQIDYKEDFTDEEYSFWLNVRNTMAQINGKAVKEYTKDQMLKWYNKLHTDSAEYKMWGNGIALPCALYVMQGIAKGE